MKIFSWNVNGIRSGINKGTFFNFLEKYNPDIIGLQEVKANIEQVGMFELEKIKSLGYEIYWNGAKKLGYSGTAILSKIKPINVFYGLKIDALNLEDFELDEVITNNEEGRVITLEYDNFYFINVYTPNSKRELERLEYRKIWDIIFLKYIKKLEEKKTVIFCGDLNVAHKEIDLANPNSNKTTKTKPGNAGFTDIERKGMDNYIKAGFIDTYRFLYPNQIGAYSRWSNFGKSREKNVGWRIDYFLISNSLKNNLKNAFINQEVLGSDHCPVGIEIFN